MISAWIVIFKAFLIQNARLDKDPVVETEARVLTRHAVVFRVTRENSVRQKSMSVLQTHVWLDFAEMNSTVTSASAPKVRSPRATNMRRNASWE